MYQVGVVGTKDTTLKKCIELSLYGERDVVYCMNTVCGGSDMPGYYFHMFRELPQVLLIQLGRNTDKSTTNWSRAKCHVPEYLDLSELLEKNDTRVGQQGSYELIGVVSHGGGINSGHEIVYVRTPKKEWFEVDCKGRAGGTRVRVDAINNNKAFMPVLAAYVKKTRVRGGTKTDNKESTFLAGLNRSRTSKTTPRHDPTMNARPALLVSITTPRKPLTSPASPESSSSLRSAPMSSPVHLSLPRSIYVGKSRKEYRKLCRNRGLKIGLHTRYTDEWYIDLLGRHDADAATYEEYTVDGLKKLILGRSLTTKGIKTRADALKALHKDDAA